jgi:acetyl-CoA carboxylase biotin carboxyl carrier protein
VARKSATPPTAPTPAIDSGAIRELAKLLDETGLTEIELQRDGALIRVARTPHGGGSRTRPAEAADSPAAVAIASPTTASLEPAQHPGLVASPMVGTAYRGPAPGARPYVDIGTEVKVGETLLIIEAMKTMNQIPAPRAGTVTQILVEDGQPVEYGEPLMIVE